MRNDAQAPDSTHADYVQRVNRAIDHVLGHLDGPLPLEAVAERAGFSPFHFHRVFRSLVGETLNQFVKRVRLERALRILSYEPGKTLTEVALESGFQSSSDFSRSFKKAYGVPPSDFDLERFRAERREGWQSMIPDERVRNRLAPLPPGENPDGFEPVLRELPGREVAYLRVPDPYRPDAVTAAAERLVAWAEERGLADGEWLGYMWDDPELVPHEKCRYDVAVVLDGAPRAGASSAGLEDGEVGRFRFPPMRVAELELRGSIELEQRALDWLFRSWLPTSGHAPSDQPAFEAWIGRPFAHGLEHFELRVQLPVVRALGARS